MKFSLSTAGAIALLPCATPAEVGPSFRGAARYATSDGDGEVPSVRGVAKYAAEAAVSISRDALLLAPGSRRSFFTLSVLSLDPIGVGRGHDGFRKEEEEADPRRGRHGEHVLQRRGLRRLVRPGARRRARLRLDSQELDGIR